MRAARKKALPKKFMRSDKSSQMRGFYVGLIVEGVNEDITPGRELEEEIGQHACGGPWREVDYEGPPGPRCSASETREPYYNNCHQDLRTQVY